MPRKKITSAKELTSQMTGIRLSKHEAICAERMKTLLLRNGTNSVEGEPVTDSFSDVSN